MKVAIYTRVSTDGQSVNAQLADLRQTAERRGWEIVREYTDKGISGAKGRDKRPGLDAMLKAATRREFDLAAAWSVDRLGRSLQHLVAGLGDLQAAGARDRYVRRVVRVVEVEEAVCLVVGVERHAKQATLVEVAARAADQAVDVKELRVDGPGREIEDPDHAPLLDNEQPRLVTGGVCDEDRAVEPTGDADRCERGHGAAVRGRRYAGDR